MRVFTDRFSSHFDTVQSSLSLSREASKIELNQYQLWRLSISLQRSGCKDSNAVCSIRFVEDKNFEPPQGRVFIEDDFNGFVAVDSKGYSGTWTLSEDKADRKDGLWICMKFLCYLCYLNVLIR